MKNENIPRTPKPRWIEFDLKVKDKLFIVWFSFEEEQQELKKSLSKDWCDKMDNAEAEEKKLHR